MNLPRRLLTALLLCAGPFTAIGPAHAWCRLTTDMPIAGTTCATGGIGLAWKRSCISFSMTARTSPEPPLDAMRDVGDTCFKTWASVMCNGKPFGLAIAQTADLGQCETPEYNKNAANANTVIFVTDWDARNLPADVFGLTLVWHNPNTGQIYDADIQLNETLGPLTICSGVCPPGAVDLQNVLTHEAGHFLGLGHSLVSGATMEARATLGETKKRDLAQDDIDGVCSIYGARTAPQCTLAGYAPDRGFSPICMPPAQSTPGKAGCGVAGTWGTVSCAPAIGLLCALAARARLRRRRQRLERSR